MAELLPESSIRINKLRPGFFAVKGAGSENNEDNGAKHDHYADTRHHHRKGKAGGKIKVNKKLKRIQVTALENAPKDINGKDYKAKKSEYDYDNALKLIKFKGENLAGSWAVK